MKNNELLVFHLAKLGFGLDKDFLQPIKSLESGDPEYAIRLREINDKLSRANCTFDEIGITNDVVAMVIKNGAIAYAKEIVRVLKEEPSSTLNPARLIMLEREMKVSRICLSQLLINKKELMALLPPVGLEVLQIPPWEKRFCERIIVGLVD